MNYKINLLKNKNNIAIWGTGYIGLSTMMYFAKKGVSSVGFDVDSKKVRQINKGILPINELKDWFGFDIKPFIKKRLLSATSNLSDLQDKKILAHFIAIPTEKDGKPYFKILFKVLKNIVKIIKTRQNKEKIIIIIESTLTPGFSEKKIIPYFKSKKIIPGKDFIFAVAPRRDWFVEGTKSLENLDRVFGSTDTVSSKHVKSILSIVCKKLHEASSHRVSEMVKSIENAYRHVEITLANQLSLAYPKENMREVLKLVGTKWNIGTFYPGFGSGGYCIPLSSQYVLQNIKKKKDLTLLRETIKTDKNINLLIARSLVKKKFKNIGVLGLSYKGNLKVSILSPIIPFVKELKKHKMNVKVFDPYYSKKEIHEILGVKSFRFPQDLKQFDCLILAVDHNIFKKKTNLIFKNLNKVSFILDNNGVWENFKNKLKKHNYHMSGNIGWI
jgi:nucleotide sugar dehydrogenase